MKIDNQRTWLFPDSDGWPLEIEAGSGFVTVIFQDGSGFGYQRKLNTDCTRRLIMSLVDAAKHAGCDTNFQPPFPDMMMVRRRMEWKGNNLWLGDKIVGSIYPGECDRWCGATAHGGVIDEIAFTDDQAKRQVVWAMQKAMEITP